MKYTIDNSLPSFKYKNEIYKLNDSINLINPRNNNILFKGIILYIQKKFIILRTEEQTLAKFEIEDLEKAKEPIIYKTDIGNMLEEYLFIKNNLHK